MKVKVFMHSGENYEIEVESYNPAELNDQRNDETISSILIGDYSLSRINIRDVIPIKEQQEETEEPIQDEPIEESQE